VYQYKIEHVAKVRSGDTLELIIDLGFKVSTTVTIRLDSAETPEYGSFDRYGKDEGQQARDFTVAWFKDSETPFTLHTLRDRRGDYFGTVYDAQGVSLGDALVAAGLARTVT